MVGQREWDGGRAEGMYLDNDETGAGIVGALEVDVGLVVRDVETLDGRALVERGGGCSDCQSGEE